MLAKLERRSISWWLFIMVTSVMGASILTVFSYNVYALCSFVGQGMTCQPGVDCGGVPTCLANYTVFAKIANLIYPDNQNQNCPAPHPCNQSTSISSNHSIEATAGPQGCRIIWHYGHVVGTSGQPGVPGCVAGNPIDWRTPDEIRDLGPNEIYTNSYSNTTGPVNVVNNCPYLAQAYSSLSSNGTADAFDKTTFTAHCQ